MGVIKGDTRSLDHGSSRVWQMTVSVHQSPFGRDGQKTATLNVVALAASLSLNFQTLKLQARKP